jgi:putative transposase
MHTMPRDKLRPTLEEVKALLAEDQDFLRPLVQAVLQELLEAGMAEALGAEKGERTPARLGYRAGYYPHTWYPDGQAGAAGAAGSSRPVLDRAVRALSAVREGARGGARRDVREGVSTRKVKAITEELCGHSFSAAAISAINVKLDEGLTEFARRRLDEVCPYLILDARYERVWEAGVIRGQAVLLAIGINWDGRHSVLAVELANRESRSSWRDFPLELRQRGLSGVEFVVGRPCRTPPGDPRDPVRSALAALLRALSQERARPRAAQGRR